MNQVITASSLPLETDYALPSSENDSHAHHSSYAGGVDQLRRNPPVGHSGKAFISLSTQYIPNRPLAHEAQFHSGVAIPDSSPGSISTSPSSNASSLATYSPFATNSAYQQHTQSSFPTAAHYPNGGQLFTASTGFPHPFQVMSGARTRGSSITDSTTTSGMLPPTRSPGIGNPVSPPFGGTARGNYTTSTPHLSRHTPIHPPRSRDETLARVQYGNLADGTPRALHTAAMSLSPPAGGHYNTVSSVLGYQPPHERHHETPPFTELQTHLEMTCDGQRVLPQIEAKIEKGFFYSSDRTWTCYRRNYFSVACSYSLNPHVPNGRLYVNRGGKHQPEQIQALAVSLSAVVDGQSGKIIELVQHTPKRDKGPQMQIGKEKIAPTPPGKSQTDSHGYNLGGFHNPTNIAPPHLPLQTEPDPSTLQHPGFSPSSHTATTYQHTFERIQFKSATANNGKRRAQQQYYHLIVELWADIRNPRDTSANWVKIAQRMSAAVVVRGRSPSHYQNEGPHTSSSPRGGAGGSSGTGSGHMGLSGAGGAGVSGRSIGSLSLLGSGALSAGIYRSGQYSVDPSPAGSHSVSPTSPINAAQVDTIVPEESAMNEGENKVAHGYEGYQYFPAPIYEGGLLPAIKSEGFDEERKVKDEYTAGNYATTYHTGGCGRFQGVESSRGFYPDLPAGF